MTRDRQIDLLMWFFSSVWQCYELRIRVVWRSSDSAVIYGPGPEDIAFVDIDENGSIYRYEEDIWYSKYLENLFLANTNSWMGLTRYTSVHNPD